MRNPRTPPVREWQARYERYLYSVDRSRTADRYHRVLEKFLSDFPNKRHPGDFLRPDIEDWKLWQLRQGRKPATLKVELAAVKGFFTFLKEMDVVAFNAAKGVSVH